MRRLVVLLMLASFVWACDSGDDEKTARIEVRLTDAPGEYEKVNIDIQAVEVHTAEGEQSSGWRSLNVQRGVYNLLDFRNGLDTLLASAEIPAGKISQIRLILGDDNTLVVDGEEHALATPSAQQSGLKLNLHEELTAGITYKVLIDFDAARSIVRRGNGSYGLKPVIKAVSEATSGAIKGVVDPATAMPAVFAIVADDTIASAYADATGKFLIRGVPEGTYTVGFSPKAGFNPWHIENVFVVTGNVTDLGTVTVLP